MRGVFWLVGDELLAFPFEAGAAYGVAKSGRTFNHRLLWEHIWPLGCIEPYNYYPRGRVDMSGKGRSVIYMSPNIGEEVIPQIMEAFGLAERPTIHYDGSGHYRCYLDEAEDRAI